jgi:hypothetical protein
MTALPRSGVCLEDRLLIKEYSEEECSAAIRGENVPHALGFNVVRLCTIPGIRYHSGFATELYSLGNLCPEFTRALNARSITSNIIPDMKEAYEFPYCIWHPDSASEDTYRDLARRYPQMRYQVGRACAVAGYTDLYHELGLLPEVSIAEEARDNQKNGNAIYDAIMASPVKYAVMNDYKRSVDLNNPKVGAHLNGDTAVRSSLDIKQKHTPPLSNCNNGPDSFSDFPDDYHFNITEDSHVDNYEDEDLSYSWPDPEVVPLLYYPLPSDLPNVNKDIVILIAAYSGNIDRYVRLRRPDMLLNEYDCIIRGIFHDTMFAKW